MPNEQPPKQRWACRWILKNGALFDAISETTPDELDEQINGDGDWITYTALNQKEWPVYTRIWRMDVSCYIVTPHEVYLAARPSLLIQ